jgi:hypothetical protein
LQIRPAGRRSLCEWMDANAEVDELAEYGESTAAELGRFLFRDSLTHVVHFRGTGRFSSCQSGQDLISILSHMRQSTSMPDALWDKLCARVVVEDGVADTRCREERFLEGHEGGLIWEVVARLQHMRAKRDARRHHQQLYYIQAVDTATRASAPLDRDDAFEALQVVSLTSTGYLLGVAPLYIGMHVRLSASVKNVPLLVRELTGVVVNMHFHPREPPHATGSKDPIVLKYLPWGVYVLLDDLEMQNIQFLPDAPKGVICVPPVTYKWNFKQQGGSRGRGPGLELERKQIPLAPATINTHYGLQGQTARKGMIAWLTKPSEMSHGDYFLALYVMLSRPTKLDDLLIFDLPERAVLEQGLLQLPKLAARMLYFEQKAAADVAVSENIMRDELQWPEASQYPLS